MNAFPSAIDLTQLLFTLRYLRLHGNASTRRLAVDEILPALMELRLNANSIGVTIQIGDESRALTMSIQHNSIEHLESAGNQRKGCVGLWGRKMERMLEGQCAER